MPQFEESILLSQQDLLQGGWDLSRIRLLNYRFTRHLSSYQGWQISKWISDLIVALHHKTTFMTRKSMCEIKRCTTTITVWGIPSDGFQYQIARTSRNSCADRSKWCFEVGRTFSHREILVSFAQVTVLCCFVWSCDTTELNLSSGNWFFSRSISTRTDEMFSSWWSRSKGIKPFNDCTTTVEDLLDRV